MTGQNQGAAITGSELSGRDAFHALYGRWRPLTPLEVAGELDGFDRPWWVIGGWSIGAATGYRREHEDTDISILSTDVAASVEHLAGRWHVWNDAGGVLRPLGGRWTTVDDPQSQLWLRRNASSPWVLDVPLTPATDGRWTNKVLPGHVAEVADVTWASADGIRYLLPEITLLYKAARPRPKDERDFAATLPTLRDDSREWLSSALATIHPEHHWLTTLDGTQDRKPS